MKVGIVNYGMGNLASVSRALETIGHDAFIAHYPEDLRGASRIVLPGVGAFAEGMDRLARGGWTEALAELVGGEGRPLLGICLGMQFLAERGDEGGERQGLGFIGGEIVHLAEAGCTDRVPHVGWNEVHIGRSDPLLDGIPEGTDYYFVHSYAFRVADEAALVGTVSYGCEVAAIVRQGHVWGTQFHPEKSSKAGLQLLRNFVERS
jgi:imidazole glycerol-phosphate synthase subunit HisH